MSTESRIAELLGWFVVGFVVAIFAVIPIPAIPNVSIAASALGLFMGFVLPVLDILQEVRDLTTRKWAWASGLSYAVGLLYCCSSLISSGTNAWNLTWTIIEGIVCFLASLTSLLRKFDFIFPK